MDVYFYLIIALFVLAIADLVVGVSNDAVNFLNSAIGSKVAPRNVILIIAALGIFLGATFSSGMMEVARKGIFNPSFFSFADVMVIFLAVMITDIIMLDIFNTLGMPTSTTVSIVFELLGASVVTGLLMLADTGNTELGIFDLINYEKASAIIAGIFLSIFIAFSIGAFVQWFCRLLFTFNFTERLKKVGVPFAGFAVAIIVYFLLVKGVKGAVFITDDLANSIFQNGWLIVLITFLAASLIVFVVQRLFNVNPLKIVVLLGTFSLAMAFAGNDLVNFIGVPITGFQSYAIWSGSGLEASEFSMAQLASAVPTPSYMLYIAGGIMVLTLWLSAKARKVTETEVKLGAQGVVDERFRPNKLSRVIVKGMSRLSQAVTGGFSRKTKAMINWRFRFPEITEKDGPAFDLVRASVNLMVASILIAFASSLKLPLSTTYVSFMVAMGASLADRAWGRESAPYRVAGVLNVIGGWFLTAIGAFTGAGLVALIIYYGGAYMAFALFIIAIIVLIRSHLPGSQKANT